MRLGLALGGLAAALAAAEVLARHHDGSLTFPNDGRRFATRGGEHGTNSQGFHERELPAGPPSGERRVVVLGDSMTWGTGSADQAWPRTLEAALGAPFRAINLSHYGYDAEQSLATLRTFGWRFHPAAVVFATYANDLVPSELITVGEPPLFAWVGDAGTLPTRLRQRSSVARLAEGAWRARGFAEVEDPRRYRAALLGMREEAAQHSVPLVVVGLAAHVLAEPDLSRCDARAGAPGRCSDAIARTAREAEIVASVGLPYIDGLAVLRAGPERAWFNAGSADWEHPSPAGHAWLGAALAEPIRDAARLTP